MQASVAISRGFAAELCESGQRAFAGCHQLHSQPQGDDEGEGDVAGTAGFPMRRWELAFFVEKC